MILQPFFFQKAAEQQRAGDANNAQAMVAHAQTLWNRGSTKNAMRIELSAQQGGAAVSPITVPLAKDVDMGGDNAVRPGPDTWPTPVSIVSRKESLLSMKPKRKKKRGNSFEMAISFFG